MTEPDDVLLRQLARALVADGPGSRPSDLDLGSDPPRPSYVDHRPVERVRAARGALAGVVAGVVVLVAAVVALGQAGSPLGDRELGTASELVPVTSTAVPPPLDPAGHLIDRGYLISRSSWDDPTLNRLTPIGAGEVPSDAIGIDQAIAAAPPSPCNGHPSPPCDPPYSAARLARYQGFGGYDSDADLTGPGAGDIPHDVVVWVVVRNETDFALASSAEPHPILIALLIDARTGALVSAGHLLPPP